MRSCIMLELPANSVQELNVGTPNVPIFIKETAQGRMEDNVGPGHCMNYIKNEFL